MASKNGSRRRRPLTAVTPPAVRRRQQEEEAPPPPIRRRSPVEATYFKHYGSELVQEDAFIDKLKLKLPNILFGNIPAGHKLRVLNEIKSAQIFTQSRTNKLKMRVNRRGLEAHKPLFSGHAYARGFSAGETDIMPTLVLELNLNLTRFVAHNFAVIQRVGLDGLIDIDPEELLYKSEAEIKNKKARSLDNTDNYLEPEQYNYCKDHRVELLKVYILKVCELIVGDLYVSIARCNITFEREFFINLDLARSWGAQTGTGHLWESRFNRFSRSRRARTQIHFGFNDWTANDVEFYWPMYPGIYEEYVSQLTRDVLKIDPQASIDLHRLNPLHSSQRTIASVARHHNAYSFRLPTGNAGINTILYTKTTHQIRLEVRYKKSIRTIFGGEQVSNRSLSNLFDVLSGVVLSDAHERISRIYQALLQAKPVQIPQRAFIRFINDITQAVQESGVPRSFMGTLLRALSIRGFISNNLIPASYNQALEKLEELGVLVCPHPRKRNDGFKNYTIAPAYENVFRILSRN